MNLDHHFLGPLHIHTFTPCSFCDRRFHLVSIAYLMIMLIMLSFALFQPTQQQTRYRKSPYAPSDGEGMCLAIRFAYQNVHILVQVLNIRQFSAFHFSRGEY